MNDDYPLENTKVLLVEDEERLRIIVEMMIEELGAQVVATESGMNALALYKDSPDFDLVLMDMRMVGLSGAGTYERLLEIDPNVKVVLSSGISPEKETIEQLQRNNGGFIEKPFNLETLSEVLSQVLQGHSTIRTS